MQPKFKRGFYFFHNKKVFLGLALVTLLILGSGCAFQNTGKAIKLETLPLAPLSEMPDFAQEAAPKVQEAYQFAATNPDVLTKIPCYCGCNSLGHLHNLACYVKSFEENGTVAEFDNHAAFCGVCIDITQDVMQMTREQKDVAEIRAFIDNKYSKYGPPTDTEPVQAEQLGMAGPLPESQPGDAPGNSAINSCGQSAEVTSCQQNSN